MDLAFTDEGFLLTDPVNGYAVSSWKRGYGDFRLSPDLTTARTAPWLPGAEPAPADPARGRRATAGTEPEFVQYRSCARRRRTRSALHFSAPRTPSR
ncbi:hypothetical protein [Streptomyces canus]|uniref:hypothetical protein n=1 Tax=Streptomyces canus TaxID=58343 RepID=UPI003253E0DC